MRFFRQVAVGIFLASLLHAQQSASPRQRVREYVIARGTANEVLRLGSVLNQRTIALEVAARKAKEAGEAAADNLSIRRIDRQGGESAGGGGTTSLVAKSGVTDFLSAAFEAGALARKQEGTVTTFRFNGLATSCLFRGPGATQNCPASNPFNDTAGDRRLRGFSASVSFDNESTKTTTTALTAANFSPAPILNQITGGGRLSSATARFEFLPGQVGNADLESFRKAVLALDEQQNDFVNDLSALLADARWTTAFAAFRGTITTRAMSLPADPDLAIKQLLTVYDGALDALAVAIEPAMVADLRASNATIEEKLSKAYSDVLLKPRFTIEYAHEVPSGQTAVSTLRFVGDVKFWKTGASDYDGLLTFNAATSFYERIPAGLSTGQWRSTQASVEAERKLGPQTWKSRPTFSLAGYYQYQASNAILEFDKNALAPGTSIPLGKPAAEVLNTTGHIGIVQGKLTLKLNDKISVPLAVSWANRTELVKADTVRGQVGISLDLGNLFKK